VSNWLRLAIGFRCIFLYNPMPELIWDAKYRAGKKAGPVRNELPFQTVETVKRERPRSPAEPGAFLSRPRQRMRLIWGDKKYVLPILLWEFAGRANLIYIDRPFDTGADFSFTATIGDYPRSTRMAHLLTKKPSILEQKAYRDTWGVSKEERRSMTSTASATLCSRPTKQPLTERPSGLPDVCQFPLHSPVFAKSAKGLILAHLRMLVSTRPALVTTRR
jgi:hypothetical protein